MARNYLLAVEVDERIADHRIAHKCSERLIDGTVSGYCAECHHYDPYSLCCTIRDDIVQGLNEDAAYSRTVDQDHR